MSVAASTGPKIIPILLLSVLLLVPANPLGLDSETVYYIGDCHPSERAVSSIGNDPAIDLIAVPATVWVGYFTNKEVARALRIYLPRTYDQLLDGDVILISDVRSDTISAKWLGMFTQAVKQDGLGFMMIGGVLSFGGCQDSPSWAITSIGDLLPVSPADRLYRSITWKPVVVDDDDPLMTVFPWDTCPPFKGYNEATLKDGAKLLAKTDDADNPFMAFWEVGNGRSFSFCTDWTPYWGYLFWDWQYYPDFTVFSIYYTTGREIPQDVELLHLIRSKLNLYKTQRDILVSLLSFIEEFGANVADLEDMIEEAHLLRKEADESYIYQEYEECLSTMEDALEELTRIEAETIKAKDRALIWIYLIEWLTVLSVLMICGTILWTIMIRRRLYREVRTTRTF